MRSEILPAGIYRSGVIDGHESRAGGQRHFRKPAGAASDVEGPARAHVARVPSRLPEEPSMADGLPGRAVELCAAELVPLKSEAARVVLAGTNLGTKRTIG